MERHSIPHMLEWIAGTRADVAFVALAAWRHHASQLATLLDGPLHSHLRLVYRWRANHEPSMQIDLIMTRLQFIPSGLKQLYMIISMWHYWNSAAGGGGGGGGCLSVFTIIIYSSISHQHIFQQYFANIQNIENRESENSKTRFTNMSPSEWSLHFL